MLPVFTLHCVVADVVMNLCDNGSCPGYLRAGVDITEGRPYFVGRDRISSLTLDSGGVRFMVRGVFPRHDLMRVVVLLL